MPPAEEPQTPDHERSDAPQPTLAQTALLAASGDERALDALQKRLTPGLRRLFLERSSKHHLAEELVQRALAGLWEALRAGRYDPSRAAITTFAYAIANKVWLQHLRASGRADAALDRYTRLVAGGAPRAVDAEDAQEFSALVQALRDVIADRPHAGEEDVLSAEERWLVRSWAMGESDRTLAKKMGIAPSNVNFRKQGVYAKLRAYLSRRGYDSPG
jgi:RNA polymerase sigma factor (sigma-70 family)